MTETGNELKEFIISKAGFDYDDYNGPLKPKIDDLINLVLEECLNALWTNECFTNESAADEYDKNYQKIRSHFNAEESN